MDYSVYLDDFSLSMFLVDYCEWEFIPCKYSQSNIPRNRELVWGNCKIFFKLKDGSVKIFDRSLIQKSQFMEFYEQIERVFKNVKKQSNKINKDRLCPTIDCKVINP